MPSNITPADSGVAYQPETASDFFAQLSEALHHRPHYRRVYDAMAHTFRRCLEEKTSQTRIIFSGDFAKTDYLLKEYGATPRLARATNDTRVRLRRRCELDEALLQQMCLYDLKTLCQFVAFVYDTVIPQELTALFPTEKVPDYTPLLVGECMRVIVARWDDECVYVETETPGADGLRRVCYAHGNQNYDFDWTYLKGLFREGTQLNLVRPREDDGTIYPELIIFEPDYLVNISSVAHCFTSYAESPLVELIRRLEPQRTTDATVLGNLAGQLLDEAIRQMPPTHTYADSVKTFFRDNALSLLTIAGGAQFHEEGQRQKRHIDRALRDTLPSQAAVGRFDPKEGIVEPSFYSEMLGLQGRMDYLQMDLRVLMEQKSGKGAFPYDNFCRPRQTEEHYVQMLLYMALIRYNYRRAYEHNGKELHAFLLYSKYEESLLGLGFAPELIFRAIRVRNQMAWAELYYTQPDAYRRVLGRLTPEQLNQKHASGRLWQDWQRPQIASVLDPIHLATPLEQAYYYRFLTFIANEHAMAKLGNKTKECSGFAATWQASVEEKRQAGNIYDRLRLLSPDAATTGRVRTVELRFAETAEGDMSNFRVGDIVMLYPYDEGSEPDARRTMVFRCTIEALLSDRLRLALRAVQTDGRVFLAHQGKLWAIEHDFMESAFAPLYRGMQAFLSAPQQRRDLLLLQRQPEVDTSVALNGSYGAFDTLALRVKQARDLFLIIGPPGTGKTSFGMLNTVKEELTGRDACVLVLSYTNRAVDEICSKLVGEGIDFIRVGGTYSCADAYRDKLLITRVEHSDTIAQLRDTLLAARVVVGTTASLSSNIALLQMKHFSLAVVDEASQILEPHLIGLLSAHSDGTPAIAKVVLIGDHKQLPAVVQQTPEVSRTDDPLLHTILLTDCRLSLFERLLRRYAHDETVTYMLRRQGRMHPDIAHFPNHAFYADKLIEVPLPHQMAVLPLQGEGRDGISDLLRTRRIAFIAADAPQQSPSDKVNLVEANMIAAIVERVYQLEHDTFDADETVGVIVPYRNQIAAVRAAIDRYGVDPLRHITIDTVERFQGSQRRYIVYGFTVQKHYQLKFLTSDVFTDDIDGCIVDRKLNVAMTRAEEHLVMVGNASLLAQSPIFDQLMHYVGSRHGLLHVAESDFVSGRFAVPTMSV